MFSDHLQATLSALLFLALTGVEPPTAKACGGFFCSAQAPVNQAAERIIFAKNVDDTVTAIVQIQYSGPAEQFAWVLPVPGVPDVSVSSDLAFQRLQTASNPQYIATQVVEGECREGSFPAPESDSGVTLNGGLDSTSGPDVDVLASGTVGPYDFVVIRPDSSFSELGDVAVDWLTTEGYDVVPAGGDPDDIARLLGSYLEGGMNLLAFRLSKGNAVGTIRPIRITYETDEPMIPIRPTAVAADDDMGVLVWVLGEHRAVPVNYRTLVLNEALIDWRLSGANYNQVVIAAANEAGGQGFVTERAGASQDYDGVLVLPEELDPWDYVTENVDSLSARDVANRAIQSLQNWDGFSDVAERFLPGVTGASGTFVCSRCSSLDDDDYDKQAFVDALNDEVVDPMRETQELLLSRPYVTRLYTTLSADEMDVDPLFNFNPDLGDASNMHSATWVIECNPFIFASEAPSRFELEDGRVVRVDAGEPWPFVAGTKGSPPANSLVMQLSTSGNGAVIEDNRAEIDRALDRLGSGGCSATPATSSVGWLAVGLLSIVLVGRRRSAR
ncbi:MAG: DUF2330 domain-containing protein [Myxococcota bacterium]